MNIMTMSRINLALLLAGGLFWAGSAIAQVYTWTDDKGVVHYADMPDDEDAQMVAIKSRRTNPSEVSEEGGEATTGGAANAGGRQKRTEIDAERRQIEAQNEAARADGCKRAQAAVENYNTNRRFYKPLPNGERQWLSEQEVAEAKAAAEQAVQQYCD